MRPLTISLTILLIFSGCITPNEELGFPEDSMPKSPGDVIAIGENDISIIPSHDSILIAPGPSKVTDLTLDGTPIQAIVDDSGNLTIPFLEPQTQYTISIEVSPENHQLNVSTHAAPHSWSSERNAWVAPGYLIHGRINEFADGWCTLGAILQDATNETLYGLTAGHCGFLEDIYATRDDSSPGITDSPGNMTDPHIGVVELVKNEGMHDYMLIRITDEARPHVSPKIVHWTGPLGLGTTKNLYASDAPTVCWYGHGQAVKANEASRHRCGMFEMEEGNSNASIVSFGGSPKAGDSGAPIIDYETGHLIAILRSTFAESYVAAPTICSILNDLTTKGYYLKVATAEYSPPPADVVSPAPPLGNAFNDDPGCRELYPPLRNDMLH